MFSFKSFNDANTANKTADPDFSARNDGDKDNLEKTVGPVFVPKAKQPKKKVWPIIATLVICAILGGLLMLSRPVVTWRTPSFEELENYLLDGYSAIGCYEVRTRIPIGKETKIEFEVGDAYNACIVLISGETQKIPVAVIVSDGIATVNLEPNDAYLLQIETEVLND